MQTNYYNNQLAVQLNEESIIENVIVNTYEDIDIKQGESIIRLFSDDSHKTFFDQYSAVMNDQMSMGKRVVLCDNQTAMMFMIKENKQVSLFAFGLEKELINLFDELVEINNDQVQSIRELYRKLTTYEDESKLLEEVMLINNSLINAKRELSIKNRKLNFLNDELERINNIDYLTKVSNRRKFYHDIHMMLQDHDIILTMMDFNNFKFVNDHYGHKKGDELLCFFSNTIKKLLDKFDGRLYRLGGDEFAILVYSKKNIDVKKIINKVNDEIKKKYQYISLAYGSINIPRTQNDLDKVIENHMHEADLLMYHKKESYYKRRNIDRKEQ